MRGVRLHAANRLAEGRILIRPVLSFVGAGAAALVVGFAFGLQAVPPAAPIPETIQPKNLDRVPAGHASQNLASQNPGAQIPSGRQLRVASLDAYFEPGSEAPSRQSAAAVTKDASSLTTASLQRTSRVIAFEERFKSLFNFADDTRPTDDTQVLAYASLAAPSDLGGHAAARPAVGRSSGRGYQLASLSPPTISKKQLTDAPEDASSPPEEDGHTAIYDISAHKVYLPNGRSLEAHSGLGHRIDDPRYVRDKDLGPTPPNVYDLSLREEPFHGVHALRLTPVGHGNMYGRDGLLAHSYMLGPNGQSNGCVSFSDYPAFLSAYQSGEVTRLVVVDHLETAPSPKTVAATIAEKLKALF